MLKDRPTRSSAWPRHLVAGVYNEHRLIMLAASRGLHYQHFHAGSGSLDFARMSYGSEVRIEPDALESIFLVQFALHGHDQMTLDGQPLRSFCTIREHRRAGPEICDALERRLRETRSRDRPRQNRVGDVGRITSLLPDGIDGGLHPGRVERLPTPGVDRGKNDLRAAAGIVRTLAGGRVVEYENVTDSTCRPDGKVPIGWRTVGVTRPASVPRSSVSRTFLKRCASQGNQARICCKVCAR